MNEFSQARKISISWIYLAMLFHPHCLCEAVFLHTTLYSEDLMLWWWSKGTTPFSQCSQELSSSLLSLFALGALCWAQGSEWAVTPAGNATAPVLDGAGMLRTQRPVLWVGGTPASSRCSLTFHKHWVYAAGSGTAGRQSNGICLSIIAFRANLVCSWKMAPGLLPQQFPHYKCNTDQPKVVRQVMYDLRWPRWCL